MVLYKTKDELIEVLKRIIFEEDIERYGFVFSCNQDDSRFGTLFVEDSKPDVPSYKFLYREAICHGYYPEVKGFRDYLREFISKQQDRLNEVKKDICKECSDIKELYFTLNKEIQNESV